MNPKLDQVPSSQVWEWALNQQFWEMLESMPDAETAFTSHVSTKDLPQYESRVVTAAGAELTEDLLLAALDQQSKQVRAYHAKMQVDQKLWTPQQGVSYAETGCLKCVDGTDERDRDFRCLEHRDAFMTDTDGFEWNKQYRRYECATHGIADIDLPDPHDTIEARHRWADRRSRVLYPRRQR